MLALEVFDGSQKIVLEFEHSLLSLSKWESKVKKPFLTREQKAPLEMLDYYMAMLISPVDPGLVYRLAPEQLEELFHYINDSQSATTITPDRTAKKGPQRTPTSEALYAQMVALKIPFHPTETWHLNRIMTLIALVSEQNQPPKKQSKADALKDWMATNEKNRAFFKSQG